MFMPDFRSPVTWILTTISVVAVGGAGWGLMHRQSAAGTPVPAEFSVESLKAQAKDDPGKMMGQLRETMQREDLTEEQRRQIGENMRKVWEDTMQERVDEYYSATSDEERRAILDRQIDEFEQRRKEWQARQAEAEKKNGSNAGPPPGFAGRPGAVSREERKERAESRNPDQTARQMAYFAAMRQRMNERGIKPPSFGRGGPGGAGRPSGP